MYTVDAEIYPVSDNLKAKYPSAPKDWHEYRVTLVNEQGEAIEEWDSLNECFNGAQFLDKQDCENAIKNIRHAVASGDAKEWFTFDE